MSLDLAIEVRFLGRYCKVVGQLDVDPTFGCNELYLVTQGGNKGAYLGL